MAFEHSHPADENNATRSAPVLDAGGAQRLIEARVAPQPLSAAEQHRVVELLCMALERRLKKHGEVDLSLDLSVDADAPEEANR